MNTENNMNPMSLDDLFAASPAPVAPESTPLPEIAQTAPTETIVPEPTPSTEQQTTPFAAEQPAASQPDNIIDLFGAVVEQSEEDSLTELMAKSAQSRPVFDYASIQDEIKDADMTFEQLRVKMSADCPELEARAHVSWSLRRREFFLSLHTRQSAKAWMRQKKRTRLSAIFLRRTGRFTKCAATRSVRLSRRPRKSWSWTWYGQGFR